MRIRNDGPNLPTERSGEAELAIDQGTSSPRASHTPPATDQLELSPNVQVLRTALDEAAGTPEIREDLVRRMQALNDRGELGRDAGKLADAIIDNWLGASREGEDA
jgi:anti-sigma28 factor (negative regulator of flagellin synthesis)